MSTKKMTPAAQAAQAAHDAAITLINGTPPRSDEMTDPGFADPRQRRSTAEHTQAARVGGKHVAPPPEYPARERKRYEICETFDIDLGPEKEEKDPVNHPNVMTVVMDPKTKKPKKRLRYIDGYADKTPWVPPINPAYEFDDDDLRIALMAVESKDRLLIHGHTGVGKTSMLEQIAARLNYNFARISFDGGISRSDLVGTWVIAAGGMEFMWGVLPIVFRLPGTIIVLDEWDATSGDCAFVLQRPLEKDDGKLLVLETGGTLIPLHEDNVIAATANTRGLGDETGHYAAGTRVQNFSQLNRFQLTIEKTYMAPAKEKRLLKKKFPLVPTKPGDNPGLRDNEINQLVDAATKIREAYEHNEISVPLSPRDLLNWAEKFLMLGSPERAAKYCFLNRMPKADAETVFQIIQRTFPQ